MIWGGDNDVKEVELWSGLRVRGGTGHPGSEAWSEGGTEMDDCGMWVRAECVLM